MAPPPANRWKKNGCATPWTDPQPGQQFLLDTRPLRAWLKANSAGKSVLNTFAYTGSLARPRSRRRAASCANRPQHDFLSLARRTWALNGWSMPHASLRGADFFIFAASLKRGGCRFDTSSSTRPFSLRAPRTGGLGLTKHRADQ
jgi:23S rRNA G2069 N7-methylase RlmK/C1962 C5-methylase RlmI